MQQYLEMAPRQMLQVPSSEVEWRSFWDLTMPYQEAEESDRFFDLLLQAGLCANSGQAGDTTPSIAVLPFANLSDDAEQEYFSDGITWSLILNLGMFEGINVRSQK
jgi:hypothetical protein